MVESKALNWLEGEKESCEMLGNRLSQWRCREKEEDIESLSSLSDVYSEDEHIEQQCEEYYQSSDSECCDNGDCEESSDSECCLKGDCEDCVKSRQDMIKSFSIQIPDKQQWIASWLENKRGDARRNISKEKNYCKINVYGYYKKKKDVGGYGIILRDLGGRPVSAFAWSSKGRGSYLYYLLKGLRRALKIASAHGIKYGVKVTCNSNRLPLIVDLMFHSRRYCLHRNRHLYRYKRMKFCQECAEASFDDVKGSRSDIKQLVDIVEDIRRMGMKFDVDALDRSFNEAAYYLAKHFKNKREVQLSEFPPALREIIWEDAYGGQMRYSEREWVQAYKEQIRKDNFC